MSDRERKGINSRVKKSQRTNKGAARADTDETDGDDQFSNSKD
jgi:hypothetical protein